MAHAGAAGWMVVKGAGHWVSCCRALGSVLALCSDVLSIFRPVWCLQVLFWLQFEGKCICVCLVHLGAPP